MKLFEQIQHLVDSGNFDEALKIINKNLEESSVVPLEDERFYATLLQKRIALYDKLNKIDDEINAVVRNKVYPSEETYKILQGPEIKLIFRNLFTQKLDAFVSTIHESKLFEFSERGASADLIKIIGKESVNKQIEKLKKLNKGDFLILRHKELKTPVSFHILYYQKDRVLDLITLEAGIIKVLNEMKKMSLQNVGFFALGFNEVLTADEKYKTSVAETLSDKVAETFSNYFFENPKSSIQQITFGFVNHQTMQTYSRAFYRWSKMKNKDFIAMKEYSKKEMKFIKEIKVKDEKYLEAVRRFMINFDNKTPLLLLGETGVGKSHIANLIHKFSKGDNNPFVEENCALFRPENSESKLFGWKKGAYTDAKEDGQGAIELANNGTLFLDEIGITELRVQSMLLKFLDTGKYQRYGERNVLRESNARLIFGTNADLPAEVSEGRFREDLFERIFIASFRIPPLRQRVDDIPPLVEEFLGKLNEDRDHIIDIEDSIIEELKKFEWPGNIRQLKAYIENLYNECLYRKKTRITKSFIKDNPPRNELYIKNNSLSVLESSFRKLISEWDDSYGRITKDILEPVLAKVFIKDLKLAKDKASKILGIDGSSGTNSTLDERFEKYKKVQNEIFKLK